MDGGGTSAAGGSTHHGRGIVVITADRDGVEVTAWGDDPDLGTLVTEVTATARRCGVVVVHHREATTAVAEPDEQPA